uniref:Uncharacterized protein n=2 Tax=Trichogramma kaykai TaxID=54128 RepID=A0ABD2WA96_9HYME
MNRTLDRLTKYYDLTDMNLHRVWDKLHHLQQDQEYIVETIDLMNKVLLDLNLNRRLAAEEAQLVFESEPITFEANKIDEKIEHATPEVIETPKRKAITTKQKNIPEPRRMPERRATKQKLMDPNFVYKAKVPELKIDDIEVHANLAKINEDPASYKEAIQSEHRDKWTAAIEEELKSMKDNKRHDR